MFYRFKMSASLGVNDNNVRHVDMFIEVKPNIVMYNMNIQYYMVIKIHTICC